MIALLERRQQLYWLMGITAVAVALFSLVAIHLPHDVTIVYPAMYALISIAVVSGLALMANPGFLRTRPYLFWPIAGALFPALEGLAVYFTGGARSPFFVLFYFSVFFLGMVGGHRGAVFGSILVGTIYVLVCVARLGGLDLGSLTLRLSITVASFYGMAFFAAFLGNIAWQQARDASRRAMRLAGLNAINASLSDTIDLHALLDKIPRELCGQLGFERALLYMLRDGRLHLVAAYSNQEPERLARLEEFLTAHPPGIDSHTVEAEVARTLQPVKCTSPGTDSRVNPTVLDIAQSKCFAAAPLAVKDELLGVVVADYFRQSHSITEEEMFLLGTFASMAALAIANRNLLAEMSRMEAVRQADMLKTEFLATVSHELRTPLTLVKTSTDLLIENLSAGLTPVQRKLIETVSRNNQRLAAFVEEILEMAQLEEGRVGLDRQLTDLRYLVDEVVQALQLLVGDRNQTLYVDLPDEDCPVMVDRHRMQQIITNLITNACKYTPEGGQVWVRLRRHDDHLVVEVEDNGPGIPSDKLGHIFEKFYRVPGSEMRVKGTGLGLAITRSLVELHGSEIHADSTPGKGSRFWFDLQLATAEQAIDAALVRSD